jgi:ATP-binding cassette, subfamily B, multidrug efflux pump
MNRLPPYIRRHWLGYVFGITCTFLTGSLAMVGPYLLRDAVNAIESGHFDLVPWYAKLMGCAALMLGATRWFSRFVIFNCGRDVEYELRNDLFEHLTALGPGFYQRFKTGDLMSRMINDLTAVRMMVGMGVLTFCNTPVYFIYAVSIMASMNLPLTLISILPYFLLFVGIRRLTRSLMERSLRVQEGLGAIGAKVQESLAGVHVIKAHTLEEHDAARFRELNDKYNEQGLAVARLRGAMMPMIRSAVTSSTMVVLIFGGSLVMSHRISIGDLIAFMAYLALLAWPVTSLGWMISIYQRGKASMQRLGEIFDAPRSTIGAPDGAALTVAGAIEWEHVSFSYFAQPPAHNGARNRADSNGATSNGAASNGADTNSAGSNGVDSTGKVPYALRDVSVTVPAGGKLAIVGRTGSGKSTMVKLLARLIEPTAGRVLLDGRDIRELNLFALRRAIGLVPQEPTLFSDTMARNVAFGRSEATAAEIECAARLAGLETDIAVLPRGLETIVGERGMSLSGGQKQRVTIARLLTYDPQVVVLDDALSSVDTETELAVLQSLAETVRDRTTIVVAHRASTVRDADQIIVLEHGAIAERGTHEELMARHGIYAELFHRQLLEEELARY